MIQHLIRSSQLPTAKCKQALHCTSITSCKAPLNLWGFWKIQVKKSFLSEGLSVKCREVGVAITKRQRWPAVCNDVQFSKLHSSWIWNYPWSIFRAWAIIWAIQWSCDFTQASDRIFTYFYRTDIPVLHNRAFIHVMHPPRMTPWCPSHPTTWHQTGQWLGSSSSQRSFGTSNNLIMDFKLMTAPLARAVHFKTPYNGHVYAVVLAWWLIHQEYLTSKPPCHMAEFASLHQTICKGLSLESPLHHHPI